MVADDLIKQALKMEDPEEAEKFLSQSIEKLQSALHSYRQESGVRIHKKAALRAFEAWFTLVENDEKLFTDEYSDRSPLRPLLANRQILAIKEFLSTVEFKDFRF